MFWHIQDIGSDSATLTGVQLGRRGEVSPALFENKKKCPDCGKRGTDCVHHWVKFSTQNVVLRVSRRKNVKMFSCGDSLFFVLTKCSSKCSSSTTIFIHIQAYSESCVQRLHMQKPVILGILEYSEPFNSCILTHMHNGILEYSEL